MCKRTQNNITLTAEQLAFEKANRCMRTPEMAERLGVKLSVMYNNRFLIKERDKPKEVNENFDIEAYRKELVTI